MPQPLARVVAYAATELHAFVQYNTSGGIRGASCRPRITGGANEAPNIARSDGGEIGSLGLPPLDRPLGSSMAVWHGQTAWPYIMASDPTGSDINDI